MLTRKESSIGALPTAAKAGPQWSLDSDLGTHGKHNTLNQTNGNKDQAVIKCGREKELHFVSGKC